MKYDMITTRRLGALSGKNNGNIIGGWFRTPIAGNEVYVYSSYDIQYSELIGIYSWHVQQSN